MQSGTLKHEAENLIHAAQEQTIRTNIIKEKIDKLKVNVPNLLRKSIKEGMIGSEDVLIGKFMERMEIMLIQTGMSINQKRSLRMTRVKSFAILLYIQTIS